MLTSVQGYTFRADALSCVGPVEISPGEWSFFVSLNDRRGTNFRVNFDSRGDAEDARTKLVGAWSMALDRYCSPDMVPIPPGGNYAYGSPRQPALG